MKILIMFRLAVGLVKHKLDRSKQDLQIQKDMEQEIKTDIEKAE